MSKSVVEKLGIKKGSSAIVINAPKTFIVALKSIDLKVKKKLSGKLDYIHCFFIKQRNFLVKFPKLKDHLDMKGMFWVSWPKSGKLETDLSITKVIKLGYDFGLVESKVVSIDETWSAIKFTFPKDGKAYNNSYGKLK